MITMDELRQQAAANAGDERFCMNCESSDWDLQGSTKTCKVCKRQVQLQPTKRSTTTRIETTSAPQVLLF